MLCTIQYFRRWKRDHQSRQEVGKHLTHCLSLVELKVIEAAATSAATGDVHTPLRDKTDMHCSSVISHDDEETNSELVVSMNSTTKSLEANDAGSLVFAQEEDENIDHVQKQLFGEEEDSSLNVNRTSGWSNRSSSDDFAHLKVLLMMIIIAMSEKKR